MKPVWVWLTFIILSGFTTMGWYITLPVVFGVANGISGLVSGTALSVIGMVCYGMVLWGPLMVIFLFLWAIMKSQERDVQSELYY